MKIFGQLRRSERWVFCKLLLVEGRLSYGGVVCVMNRSKVQEF